MNKLEAYLNNQVVILFDTEQAPYDVQKVARRILATAGLIESPLLLIYSLRKYDTQTRRKMIEHAIYNTPNLGMVIIDGIRDLICDINSAEEATSIATDLLRWTEERNIHIITVLHQNKGDNNARGHVGTELVNKAESVLSVEKDSSNPELSIVTPEYFRGKEFSSFAFGVDDKGLPYIDGDWKAAGEKQREAEAHNIDDAFHKARIKEAFEINPKPSYKEAWMQIQTAWMPFTRTGNNKAMGYLTYYVSKGWVRKIEKEESGKNWALYENTLPL